MDDPYKVLGLKRNATDEEIKAAYHALVKKYHPDKYQNNPLSDLAEEKLREVNEAYELLMKPKTATTSYGSSSGSYSAGYNSGGYNTGGYNTGGSYGQGSYQGSYNYGGYDHGQGGGYSSYGGAQNSSHYSVREALDNNQLNRAEELLYSSGNRDAEWYFLSGVLSYKKGYYDDALSKISYALNLAPNNVEYRSVYQQIRGTGALYKTTSTNRGYNSSSMCSDLLWCYCCSSLISPCW